MAKDVSAIHVLKSQLRLSDDDYRALLRQLTGVSSCSDMAASQLQAVRSHLAGLAQRMGVSRPGSNRHRMSAEQFAKAKRQASPKERKAWALWHQLGRDGLVANTSVQALNAWVFRQVGVEALHWCTPAQLDTVIEGLKAWQERGAS